MPTLCRNFIEVKNESRQEQQQHFLICTKEGATSFLFQKVISRVLISSQKLKLTQLMMS